jgi:galactose mutarotase-like enzyme
MSAVTLATDAIAVACDPERGFTIDSVVDRATGAEALWRRPGHEPSAPTRALGAGGAASIPAFLDGFTGGWFAMFPDVGYPLDDDTSFLHGEAVRLPWHCDAVSPTHAEAHVRMLRRPLELRRTLTVDGATLRVDERIVNHGRLPVPYAWGYHPCFARGTFAGGRIELAATSALVPAPEHVPGRAVLAAGEPFAWPYAPRRDGGAEDLSAVPEQRDGRVDHACLTVPDGAIRITAPRFGTALTLVYDARRFPHVLLWQDLGPAEGAPLWGAGDTFALEFSTVPGRSMPEAVAAGAVRTLDPGADAHTTITLTWA